VVFNLSKALNTRKKGKYKYYSYKCTKCNTPFEISNSSMYKRKTTLCQKCSSMIGLNKINIKPKYSGIYTKIKLSSTKKNIVFNLNFNEFIEFTKIRNCEYCNTSIDWNSKDRFNLDRKDNLKGYTKDNLTVCCWNCNNTKSNRFTYDEFLLLSSGLKKIMKNREKL